MGVIQKWFLMTSFDTHRAVSTLIREVSPGNGWQHRDPQMTNVQKVKHCGLCSHKWHEHSTLLLQGSGNFVEERAEIFYEPEVDDHYKQTLFSIHGKIVTYINPKQLGQHAQDLHKLKLDKGQDGWREEGTEAYYYLWNYRHVIIAGR